MSFIAVALLVAAVVAPAALAAAPDLPNVFTVTGVLSLPYAEIKEPFSAYFDTKQNKSRIDYYGGVVKTYQLPGDGVSTFGISRKVAPMTTEEVLNQINCFQVNGTKEAPITIQTVLPDLANFTKTGHEMMNSLNCTVWQYSVKIGQKKNVYTIWLADETNLPVRYEMFGYNSLLGSHYDKYYVDYVDWDTPNTSIPSVIFDIPEGMILLQIFPGPGEFHQHQVNPMHEYIHDNDEHIHGMFDGYKKDYSKDYKDDFEHASRLHVFKHNLRYIESQNRRGLTYTLAMNHLADRKDRELVSLRGFHRSPGYNGADAFDESLTGKRVPDNLDWRLYGAVTPVKDQAVCGSCWSFGTTGTVEGANFLKTGKLVRLSQQALMDCSWGEGNNACDGGEDFRAYQWIKKHGLPSEEDYGAYLAQDSYCHIANVSNTIATISSYVNVTSTTEGLRAAIAFKGPISVGIDASHKSLSFYANGVYYEPACGNKPDDLDHAVLAVGYGYMNGQGYWLIKNSWSTHWGNDGYVLMAQKDNNCGVTTAATYVVL
ncbi:hypothetical protein CAPTEDRAFT_181131 [Capitella teleta]|uniref:Peptidase C1A papain C-terminal domain-containing protein n=1 Tax=Capitella teleta TaxID=283909 RepID=R7THR6_CAPTE|nr:hypothetical protein CAPTEDRAFT_181131 [Capitella teleta]|eukprot:ELT93269.1 hypothetical protein CAPTEDRAFT_181131 [Capitella teleta]